MQISLVCILIMYLFCEQLLSFASLGMKSWSSFLLVSHVFYITWECHWHTMKPDTRAGINPWGNLMYIHNALQVLIIVYLHYTLHQTTSDDRYYLSFMNMYPPLILANKFSIFRPYILQIYEYHYQLKVHPTQ